MDLKSIAEAYQSVQEKKLDPVGKEDGDVDNDGDKDSSDSYLMKRRAAIKKAMKKEEVEQEENENYVEAYLDELKKTTMGSYIAKASKDLADRRFDQGDSEKRKYDPDEKDEKEDKKLDKREQGIARAAKKITKEHHQKDADGKVIEHEDTTPSSVEEKNDNYVEAYLDELKKTTMGSYISKASSQLMKSSKEAGETSPLESGGAIKNYHMKKALKRRDGIKTAAKKMAKEETVLEQLAENNRDIDAFEAVVSYLIDEKLAESWEQAEKIMATLKPELVQEVYQNQLWTLFDENYRAMRNPEKYKDPDESDKPYRERSKAARMRDPHRGINSPAFKKFMADRGM